MSPLITHEARLSSDIASSKCSVKLPKVSNIKYITAENKNDDFSGVVQGIRSIDKDVKVIIVENSENFLHEKMINSEFSNVEIFCTGENLGYGKGNNFGIKQAKSNYVLILNPDVICEKDLFIFWLV